MSALCCVAGCGRPSKNMLIVLLERALSRAFFRPHLISTSPCSAGPPNTRRNMSREACSARPSELCRPCVGRPMRALLCRSRTKEVS